LRGVKLRSSPADPMLSRRQAALRLLGVAAWTGARELGAATPFPAVLRRRFSVPLTDAQGQVISRYNASASYFLEDLGAQLKLDMALIPGGDSAMGSAVAAAFLKPSEQPIHGVSIKPFARGVFPVTRGQWRQVSGLPQVATSLHRLFPGNLPPEVDDSLPIDDVTWAEADEFRRRLGQFTRRPYRLPSEVEWEYACRAGTTTKYHFGD
jgi:formylglycine-generating enzyme required for sulfatase activity